MTVWQAVGQGVGKEAFGHEKREKQEEREKQEGPEEVPCTAIPEEAVAWAEVRLTHGAAASICGAG